MIERGTIITEKQLEMGRCEYCNCNSRRGCKLNLVPIKNDLCYEKECFLIVEGLND